MIEDHFEKADGNFIPGIYNYCNRWCERCIYTNRCMNFSMDKQLRKEIEEEKSREKSMEENKDFWTQVNKTIEDAANLIDEEIPLIKKEDFHSFDDWEDDEEDVEAMKEHKEKQEKAKNHELSKVAFKYEKVVTEWFKERKAILKQDYNPETKDFKVAYSGINNETELKHLSESVEVILWYHIQIYIKVRRALSSNYEEVDYGDMFEGLPKDSDGSAMVALKGINSSIGAWSFLLGKIVSERASIKQIVRMLIRLKMGIEKQFPNAMYFEWPPKLD